MVVLLLAACQWPPLPSARVQDLSLTHLDLESVGFEVRLDARNPTWMDVPIESIAWELSVGGRPVASGERAYPGVLVGGAVSTVAVPVELTWAELGDAVKHVVGPDDVPYRFEAVVQAVSPVGPVRVPIAHEGTVPRLRAPELDLVDITAETEDGRLTVAVAVHLDLPDRFSVSWVDWAIDLDRYRIGEGSMQADAEGSLRVAVTLDARETAAAGWSVVTGEAHALTFAVAGEVSTPLGTAPLSMSRTFVLDGSRRDADPAGRR